MDIFNKDLYQKLINRIHSNNLSGSHDSRCQHYLEERINEVFKNKENLKSVVENFLRQFRRKWTAVHRSKTQFELKYDEWLEIIAYQQPQSSSHSGRPHGSFAEASERTKRRKTDVLMHTSPNRLVYATSRVLKKGGFRSSAKKLDKFSLHELEINESSEYSSEEALALMLDCSLTKNTYQILRNGAIAKDVDLYPSYKRVQKAKEMCLPARSSNWKITDYSAEINYQDLFDHTVYRILHKEDIEKFSSNIT